MDTPSLILGIVLAIIAQVLAEWLKTTVQEAAKKPYLEELEDYRAELRRHEEAYKARLKRHEHAAAIAKILAAKIGGAPATQQLNRELWEASLYLPADVVCGLSTCLVENQPVKNLLIKARKEIHGDDDTLVADNIPHVNP